MEQYVLIARKVCTNYVEKRYTSATLFEPMDGLQCWDDYIDAISEKRVFSLADFAAVGRCAGEILFEREGVRGDIAASREAREGTAAGTESGAGTASGVGVENGIAGTLDASYYKGQGVRSGIERTAVLSAGFKAGQSMAGSIGYEVEKAATLGAHMSGTEPTVAIYENHGQDSRIKGPLDVSPAISQKAGTGGNQVPVASYAIAGNTIGRKIQNGGNGKGVLAETSYTLNTVDRHACFAYGFQGFGKLKQTTKGSCLRSRGNKDATDLILDKSVRRLTPLECERLQGLPDNYTLIDDKTGSDTARYKALGNGMAMPCADYVIKRIVEVCNAD